MGGCQKDEDCSRGETGMSCREARNAARRRRARAAGIEQIAATVDAEDARSRLCELRACGLSLREIARRAAVGHTTVTNVATGVAKRVRVATHERLMSVLRTEV